MTLNAALRLMAGSVVTLSLVLSHFFGPAWLWLTAFVGLNLLQSAFTRWCPAVTIFRVLGLKDEVCDRHGMNINQGVHIIAGMLILVTTVPVILGYWPQTLLIATLIIGVSLMQSAFTGWCPAIQVARMLGFKPTRSV
ncbi:YgaP family membrane protein [Marinobacterium sediminicola]|uniref:Inner membrane protein YgaP-like transmembrane domain-containing protein n=1 Tax=Marinobacterium sediminicola TaxID=518898 RepID=A0ABY1RXP2_9GAMM|nr:DUF2892 domain-containing protein [Marinobacterium sediminicola]ULG67769.1 DUF2892 domain-containing protein [Marinobacterium sediminicola]SMR71579.1 Protein of unknown function [Marinobacterium sediminicola]